MDNTEVPGVTGMKQEVMSENTDNPLKPFALILHIHFLYQENVQHDSHKNLKKFLLIKMLITLFRGRTQVMRLNAVAQTTKVKVVY